MEPYLINVKFLLKDSFRLFFRKKGGNLAAASTFYFILSLVPFCLLSFKIIGLFVTDISGTIDETFSIVSRFFPEVVPEVIEGAKAMILRPLLASKGVTFLNLIFLAVTSLSFFNSLRNGLLSLTDYREDFSGQKILKGILFLVTTVFFLIVILLIPFLLKFTSVILSNNTVVNIFLELGSPFDKIIGLFKEGGTFVLWILRSNLFYSALLTFYIAVLFHWFFSRYLKWKDSLLVSFLFVCSLMIIKSFFWLYFKYARSGLTQNYGDLYTVVIGVIWLHLTMSCFYFSLCMCQSMEKLRVKGR